MFGKSIPLDIYEVYDKADKEREAAIKQRDELAAEVKRLRTYRYRAGVAEDKLERLSAMNSILERKLNQAIASVGAVIETSACIAQKAQSSAEQNGLKHPENSESRDRMFARAREAGYIESEIRSINPDATAALNEMLADTWKEAYAQGLDDFACNNESKNPYEK